MCFCFEVNKRDYIDVGVTFQQCPRFNIYVKWDHINEWSLMRIFENFKKFRF